MKVLHPDGEDYQEEPNAGSIVLALNYGDFDALLTGDVEADGEEKLLEELQTYRRPFFQSTHIFFRSVGWRPMGASTVPPSSRRPPTHTASYSR